MVLFVEYPKCTTCKRAKAWLDARGVAYEDRHIVEEPPTAEELQAWQAKSGLPWRRFFNTSGMKYRELGLSEKIGWLGEDQMVALLASDGMLVKRPLLVLDDTVLVGFREADWEAALAK